MLPLRVLQLDDILGAFRHAIDTTDEEPSEFNLRQQ